MHETGIVSARLLALFPPPRLLTLPAVGIDISDRSVKFAALEEGRDGVSLLSYGVYVLPEGAIVGGEIRNPGTLIEPLKDIRRKTRRDFVRLSLPEEHAYLFQTDIPRSATKEEARTAIEFRLKENVPLSPSEVIFAWTPLPCASDSEDLCRVSVSVYPTRIVSVYSDVLLRAGYVPYSFEIEGEAYARISVPKDSVETCLVLDVGKNKVGLTLVQNNIVVLTAALSVGGDDFTQALRKEFSVSFEEAERIKRQYGLLRGKKNERSLSALLPVAATLREEIERYFQYWQSHKENEQDAPASFSEIQRIMLCGGGANLLGLSEYLESMLEVPVERTDVWQNISLRKGIVPPIPYADAVLYATTLGLVSQGVSE